MNKVPRRPAALGGKATRRTLVGLAIAVAGIAAVGCGSDNNNNDGGSGSPITFVVPSAVDTPNGSFPGVFAGAQAAAKAINADGGVNGHDIKIVTCNAKATAAGSGACARQAVQGKAAAVIGSDPFISVTWPVLTAAKIPSSIFSSTGQSFQVTSEFPLNSMAFGSYLGMAVAAKQAGDKKLGIICTQFPGLTEVCENVKRVAAKQGLDVVSEPTVQLTTTSFTGQVQQLKSAGADAVALVTTGVASPAIIKAATGIGYKPTWLVARAAFPDAALFATTAKAAPDFWASSSLPPINVASQYPGLQTYQKEMAAAKEAGVKNTSVAQQDESSIYTWAAVHGFAQIAESIDGDVTGPKLLAALQAKKDTVNVEDLIDWIPAHIGPEPYPGLTDEAKVYVGPVKNGRYVPDPTDPIAAAQGVQLK